MNLIDAIYQLRLPDRPYLFVRRKVWSPKTAIFIDSNDYLPKLKSKDITALDWEVKRGHELGK